MFALLAVIAFAIALILKLAAVAVAEAVAIAVIAGLLCVALHLAFGWPAPWARRPPP